MSDIKIREARLEDAQAIAELTVEAWQTAYTGVLDPTYLPTRKVENYRAKFQEILEHNQEKVLAAELDEKVVGFVSGVILSEGSYDCEVKGLYVHPTYQGQGAGRKLLEAMLSHFRSIGCQHLRIWTLLGVKNNGFYQRMGGVAEQEKDEELGGKTYRMVGYGYTLPRSE